MYKADENRDRETEIEYKELVESENKIVLEVQRSN